MDFFLSLREQGRQTAELNEHLFQSMMSKLSWISEVDLFCLKQSQRVCGLERPQVIKNTKCFTTAFLC